MSDSLAWRWTSLLRYSKESVVRLAAERDPGFDPTWFAEALKAVDRLPDTLFAAYGLDPAGVSKLKAEMRAWAMKIRRG